MLIELCIFNDCHTSASYGGCIFMAKDSSNGAGSCVINKCCSNECSSTNTGTSRGQFVYTSL